MTDQYISGHKWVWVECELPGYEGFKAEVRLNLQQGERRELREQLAAIEDAMEALEVAAMEKAFNIDERRDNKSLTPTEALALKVEQRQIQSEYAAGLEAEQAKQFQLIAPHIRAWNLFTMGGDGVPVAVPAPADGGAAVFDDLERPLVSWLIRELLLAYRGGKGLSASVNKSGEQQAPTEEPTHAGPQVIELPNTRASRTKSSGQ